LDENGLIDRNRLLPRKELNIVMDNCSGQNKNRFVLRLAPLFVELKYYRQVNIIFLVAGHTKNAADCLFNLLKILYRKSQVYTMEHLVDVLNKNQYVECVKVEKEDFYNFGQYEDREYSSSPLSGHTNKYHLFYLSDAKPGVLFAKDSNNSLIEHRMDLVKGPEERQHEILNDFDINELDKMDDVEGIRKIKQVEFYKKWRKHIPEQYKSPLYDNPGEDVLQSVKDDRKTKKVFLENKHLKERAVAQTGKLASRKSPTKKPAEETIRKQPAKKRKAPPASNSRTAKTSSTVVVMKRKTNKQKETTEKQQKP
jgi:hypothetical protein